MTVSDQIDAALRTAFEDAQIEVINESHLHAGHAGDDGSGESHFRLVVKTPIFREKSRLDRHRLVHSALGADLLGRIHALALQLSD